MKFVLFGSTGDLAKHKLIPQLGQLALSHKLPADFELLAVGRRNYTTAEYMEFINDGNKIAGFELINTNYLQVDFEQVDGFTSLFKHLDKWDTFTIFYLSVGPDVMFNVLERFCDETVCQVIKLRQALIALEKPFGSDAQTAEKINKRLLGLANEEQIYRIDHYLHKDTTAKIIPYRQAQNMDEFFWQNIASVNVVASETLTIGERAGYYDKQGGAINDWIQNHLLQLLAVTLSDFNQPQHQARTQVLESLNPSPDKIIIGQYNGYLQEPGVAENSHTETFASIQLHSTLPYLDHIPFTLATGKGLDSKQVFVELILKTGEKQRLDIDPGSVDNPLGPQLNDAYFNVLNALIQNNRNNFVSQQEIVAQWRIADQLNILKLSAPLVNYRIGTSYLQLTDNQ